MAEGASERRGQFENLDEIVIVQNPAALSCAQARSNVLDAFARRRASYHPYLLSDVSYYSSMMVPQATAGEMRNQEQQRHDDGEAPNHGHPKWYPGF
jgi:hypothetical protein